MNLVHLYLFAIGLMLGGIVATLALAPRHRRKLVRANRDAWIEAMNFYRNLPKA